MSFSPVTVEIHDAGLSARFDRAVPAATFATAKQAFKDCNYFCKEDMESLIKSSLIHSEMNGNCCELRWTAPYAAFQYDFPGTRKDKNPNACPRWCNVAYNTYGYRWKEKFINTLHREGL